MGAALADTTENEKGMLSSAGKLLGCAFQLHDDMIDVFCSDNNTGKPGFTDLKESKKTFLVRLAYGEFELQSEERDRCYAAFTKYREKRTGQDETDIPEKQREGKYSSWH